MRDHIKTIGWMLGVVVACCVGVGILFGLAWIVVNHFALIVVAFIVLFIVAWYRETLKMVRDDRETWKSFNDDDAPGPNGD